LIGCATLKVIFNVSGLDYNIYKKLKDVLLDRQFCIKRPCQSSGAAPVLIQLYIKLGVPKQYLTYQYDFILFSKSDHA